MIKYVAFMRAINVAGHAIVRMDDLKDMFADAGCKAVRTCIQSGNVLFESPEERAPAVLQRVQVTLRERIGHQAAVFFRTAREVERLVKAAPFKGLEGAPRTKLYVAFLSAKPRIRPGFPLTSPKEALEAITMRNLEVFIVSYPKKNGFYGFPNNFIEKELGVPATTRNWSTVTRIVELVGREPAG